MTNDTDTPTIAFATGVAAPNKLASQPRPRRMAREPQQELPKPNGPAPTKPGATAKAEPKQPRGPSKIAGVIALLTREEGATLAEMVAATGWLPHTTRAALTGLKRKGHVIERGKRGDVTCYTIVKPA